MQFASLFGGAKKAEITAMPDNVPRGLYLYGDVGCGKTMLMDLFYKTLPSNVESKLRIHFNNFMQNVHKRLHRLKVEHGADFDAIPFVAAEIADEGKVLCFDEFQCTDVADAMILRRYVKYFLFPPLYMSISFHAFPEPGVYGLVSILRVHAPSTPFPFSFLTCRNLFYIRRPASP